MSPSEADKNPNAWTGEEGLGELEAEMDVAEVMSYTSWQTPANAAASAVAGGSIPPEAWKKLLVRHLKLVKIMSSAEAKDGNQSEKRNSRGKGDGKNCLCHPHPLHCAASQGIVRAGTALLRATPSDLEVKDSAGRTPLHWAAMMNHSAFLKMLLDAGAKVNARDVAGHTALMSGCACGAASAARILLQYGADENAQDHLGLTPLHAAAASGYLDVAEVLLLAGADHTHRASVGASARHVAERQGHTAMVWLLAGRGKAAPRSENAHVEDMGAHFKFDRHALLHRNRTKRS